MTRDIDRADYSPHMGCMVGLGSQALDNAPPMPMIIITMHTVVFCLTEGLSEESNITQLKGHRLWMCDQLNFATGTLGVLGHS